MAFRLINCVNFLLVSSALLGSAYGCSSQPAPIAYDNQVFYEYDSPGGQAALDDSLERPYHSLDKEDGGQKLKGVEILNGMALFSRPEDWKIRSGSARSGNRFIQYVSPRQVVITLYERIELPSETWAVVLGHYESETTEQGGEILGGPVPLSSFDSQARAYDIKRSIPAGSAPMVSHSREYVMRSDQRVLLVQIVRPQMGYGAAEHELRSFVKSLRVL